jgi:hypothetical protein
MNDYKVERFVFYLAFMCGCAVYILALITKIFKLL